MERYEYQFRQNKDKENSEQQNITEYCVHVGEPHRTILFNRNKTCLLRIQIQF